MDETDPATGGPTASPTPAETGDGSEEFRLTSTAFDEGQPIPRPFSCHGENVPPPLTWEGVPPGTAELALLLDDPDAPGAEPFVHWIVLGLPASTTGLEPGTLPAAAREGPNNAGGAGYFGPCPPAGPAHRYVFTLFALSESSSVPEGTPPEGFRPVLEAVAMAQAQLTGTFAS